MYFEWYFAVIKNVAVQVVHLFNYCFINDFNSILPEGQTKPPLGNCVQKFCEWSV